MEEEQKKSRQLYQWVISLAVAVSCCAAFFLTFAGTQEKLALLSVRAETQEYRIEMLERRLLLLQQKRMAAAASAVPEKSDAPEAETTAITAPMPLPGSGVVPEAAIPTDSKLPEIKPPAIADVPVEQKKSDAMQAPPEETAVPQTGKALMLDTQTTTPPNKAPEGGSEGGVVKTPASKEIKFDANGVEIVIPSIDTTNEDVDTSGAAETNVPEDAGEE